MPDEVRDAWVARVLGIAMPRATGGQDRPDLRGAANRWRDASETVDAQIEQLARTLRGSDDEDLRDIGEYGINAVTGNFRVKLMAALIGAEAGNANDMPKLRAAAANFRAHLQTDERIEACDENPFNIPVTIRATLLPALDGLLAALP